MRASFVWWSRSKRTVTGLGIASLVAVGILSEACGLDDTVADSAGSGGGSHTDATVGSDGSGSDGSLAIRDGAVVDTGPRLLPDGAPDPGDDAAVALDAGDASFPDATASDGGSCPSGQSLCGSGPSAVCVTNCAAQCASTPLSCNQGAGAVCVPDCKSCGSNSAECFRCEAATGFAAAGTCENPSDGNSCVQNGNYLHCACFGNDLSKCPGDTQVCRATFIPGIGVCKTCGESNSKGESCKAGGKCDTGNDTCH